MRLSKAKREKRNSREEKGKDRETQIREDRSEEPGTTVKG